MDTEADSYVEDRIIPFLAANLYALALAPVLAVIILIPYFLRLILLPAPILTSVNRMQLVLFAISLPIGVVLHELLHGVGWMTAGRVEWHDIKFGIKKLTPYAHCKVPVNASVHRFASLLPGIVLGLIPGLAGCIVNNIWWVMFGVLMFIGAAGDLMVYWLIRDLPPTAQVLDQAQEVGCRVISK